MASSRFPDRLIWLSAALLVLALALLLLLWPPRAGAPRRVLTSESATDAPAAEPSTVKFASGRVVDEEGPVPQARVRWQATDTFVTSDDNGAFQLPLPKASDHSDLLITAATERHFIGSQPFEGQSLEGQSLEVQSLEITLVSLPRDDNPSYQWVEPQPSDSSEHNCGNCHAEIFEQWSASSHSRSALNRRFLNLHSGHDWLGRPDRGWSLSRDYPEGRGVCVACHAPGAALEDEDPRQLVGTSALGVHCDYCHKVHAVDTEHVGLAHGRDAISLLRPHEGQIFFGPLDDVAKGRGDGEDEDVFSPLQSESRYCATCHEGVVFGVHVYGTYSEWKESPAASRGQSCQSCHMTPNGRMTNIAPGVGGRERPPATLATHQMFPPGREAMLRDCLHLEARVDGDSSRRLIVEIEARNIGHRAPTGYIDRHLVLHCVALSASGEALTMQAGPLLPEVVGAELAGESGRLFAKVLRDEQGDGPLPFWRAAAEPDDTRLRPSVPEQYEFALPLEARSVRVRLLYRRFWPQVAQAKSWPDDTIVVHDRLIEAAP